MYRGCWTLLVNLIGGISLVLGWLTEGLWLVLAEVAVLGAMGLAFGASWEGDPERRWRVGRAWALRGAMAALVLIGLPHLIGPWSLLVLAAMGLSTPAVVLGALRRWRGPRTPAVGEHLSNLSDAELARRWGYSTVAVRSSWRTAAEVVVVVLERQRLLDEIELRDPERFAQWLVAAGWRESPSQ